MDVPGSLGGGRTLMDASSNVNAAGACGVTFCALAVSSNGSTASTAMAGM
jgi:hypothetical protein